MTYGHGAANIGSIVLLYKLLLQSVMLDLGVGFVLDLEAQIAGLDLVPRGLVNLIAYNKHICEGSG